MRTTRFITAPARPRPRGRSRSRAAVLALAAAFGGWTCGSSDAPQPAAPPAPSPSAVAPAATPAAPEPPPAQPLSGAELFERYECSGCHEEAALPGMQVRPLVGLSERYSPETLAALLAAPPDPMPLLPLDAEQRHRIAEYVLQTYP